MFHFKNQNLKISQLTQKKYEQRDKKKCFYHILDPSNVRPNHFPSGFPMTRIMSRCWSFFRARSVLLPLQFSRAFPSWMTSMGPVSWHAQYTTSKHKKVKPFLLFFYIIFANLELLPGILFLLLALLLLLPLRLQFLFFFLVILLLVLTVFIPIGLKH